jgi:hypothetical protein
MGIQPETAAIIQQFNVATTKVGERIAALVANSDLTPDEKAAFQVEVDRLTAMGTDPSDPASLKSR